MNHSFEDFHHNLNGASQNMMITQLNIDEADQDFQQQNAAQLSSDLSQVIINNDFIGKNKNMLAFYREHDSEKRQAFHKLREYFTIRAKLNRDELSEDRRQRVLDFMSHWQEKRTKREEEERENR